MSLHTSQNRRVHRKQGHRGATTAPTTYIENLIVSLKGDSNIQLRTYFGIFMCFFVIAALIAIYLLIVSRAYPDLAIEVEQLLSDR